MTGRNLSPSQRTFVWSAMLIAGLLLAQTQKADAEDYWVDAAVNTHLVMLGEPFRLVIKAGARHGLVYLPGKTLFFPGCQILDYQEADASKHHEGFLARQGVYQLVAFSLKEVLIPAAPIRIRWSEGKIMETKTLPLRLAIRSLHPEEGLSLIDPRPPHRLTVRWPLWVLLGLGVGLLGGAIKFRIQRRQKKRASQPAHVTALQALTRLEKNRLLDPQQMVNQISRVIRKYLADRYQFQALEKSRNNIIQTLATWGVEAKRRDLISELLTEIDLVKFAMEPVDEKRGLLAIQRVREIIELTHEPVVGKERRNK